MIAVLLTAPAQARTVPGSDGIGDSYFPLDGNGGIDVVRYRIHDRYRFETRKLSGRTVLTIDATQDLTSFNLDFLLPVRRVEVDGMRAAHRRPHRHEVRITPDHPIAKGDTFRVSVSYSGRPGPIGYLAEKNWLADRHEVVAMNQPHMATWWFPSNDHPSDKALMDISITVPRGKQVFANGDRVSITRSEGLATHRWRADEPMSTYLAVFAAGDFQVDSGVRDGLPWRAVVSRQLSPEVRQDNMALMRETPAVVEGLEEDLGDYPFSQVAAWSPGSTSSSRSRTRHSRRTPSWAPSTSSSSFTSWPTSGSATRWGCVAGRTSGSTRALPRSWRSAGTRPTVVSRVPSGSGTPMRTGRAGARSGTSGSETRAPATSSPDPSTCGAG